MHVHVPGREPTRVSAQATLSRSLTGTDLCLCLVPISLFLSIMSLV